MTSVSANIFAWAFLNSSLMISWGWFPRSKALLLIAIFHSQCLQCLRAGIEDSIYLFFLHEFLFRRHISTPPPSWVSFPALKLKWFRMHVTWEKIICHLLLRDHCSNDEGPAAGQWGKRLVPPPQRLASPASGPQSKKLRFKEEALTFSETCPMLWVIMGAWGIQLHTFSQAQKRGEGVGSCPGSTAT